MLCVNNGIKKYWSDQNTLAKSFFKESVKSAYCGFKEANLSFNSSRFFTRDSIDTSVPAVISISKAMERTEQLRCYSEERGKERRVDNGN